jgi:hypothetical protein
MTPRYRGTIIQVGSALAFRGILCEVPTALGAEVAAHGSFDDKAKAARPKQRHETDKPDQVWSSWPPGTSRP